MKVYEEEVISIPASWGTDGVAKYGVYSCPLKKRYNYKKSLYIAFRPAGGVVKTLYKLRDRYELMPDPAMIRNRDMDAKDKRAILGYLKDPKYKGVCSENATMQFFVLDMKHVIQFPRGGAKSGGRSPRGIVYYFLSDMLDFVRCKDLKPARAYN